MKQNSASELKRVMGIQRRKDQGHFRAGENGLQKRLC